VKTFTFLNGKMGYKELVDEVRSGGRVRSPRGRKTLDLGPTTVVLRSPYDALPLGVGRNLNTKIAVAEALQLIGAFSDPALVDWASPNFRAFQEDDGTFWGSYGERVGNQVIDVIRKLRSDRESRQAVITLWDPRLDNRQGKRDYPCTVALNFALVDDLLELRVLMRSNDVWLGTPYDWFQFTQLQLATAQSLGVDVGRYTHTTWSLHLYQDDVEASHWLHAPSTAEPVDGLLGLRDEPFLFIMQQARALCRKGPYLERSLSEGERWYRQQLSTYQSKV